MSNTGQSSRFRPEPKLPTEFLMTLLMFVLTCNLFIFNSSFWLQIHGTAMGTREAPTFACILHLAKPQAASESAEKSQEEARAALEEARAEGRQLITRAQETAARLSEELEAQARADAEQIVTRARNEIETERQQAINSLRAEFADLTVNAAERVIGQSLDKNAHQRLITESLIGTSFSESQDD